MALQSSDIGLALAQDVGDVNQLQTRSKQVVAALNELLNSAGAQNQLYVGGIGNSIVGAGNAVYGNNNMVLGSGNLVVGDNLIIIGDKKTAQNTAYLSIDHLDLDEGRIYLAVADGAVPPAAGDPVCMDISYGYYDANYEANANISSGLFLTEITAVDFENSSHIEVAAFPSVSPPEGYPIFDGAYFNAFAVLTDAGKLTGAGGISMGQPTVGSRAGTANQGQAQKAYDFAVNMGFARGSYSFACNYGLTEGSYAFAANGAKSYGYMSSAFGEAKAYGGRGAAFNESCTAGRPIKCVALSVSTDSVTAAAGEDVSGLEGQYILLRYTFNASSIAAMFLYTKVLSVSGQTLTLEADLSYYSSTMVLMSDGYIFRAEYYNSFNAAFGKSVAGCDYSLTSGMGTVGMHEGAVVSGKYGFSPESYSWALANGTSYNNRGLAAKILQNGNVSTDGTFSSPCADYAEMFEWADGNINSEDRVGFFVTLIGDKIKKAGLFEPIVLGVVSGNPAILGDSSELRWNEKYLTDDFGRVLYQDVLIPAQADENGKIMRREHVERQPVLNPNYNPGLEYIPRMSRKEWAAVGVLGKLVVYDDGTCETGGLCRPNEEGKATKSIKNGYPVLKRIASDKVLIWFK